MAVKLCENGAHYVLVPRVLSAQSIMEVLKIILNDIDEDVMSNELELLKSRDEIIK